MSFKDQLPLPTTENGGLQNTSTGYTVGAEGLQEKAVTATEKLDGHHRTRFEGHGHHLE